MKRSLLLSSLITGLIFLPLSVQSRPPVERISTTRAQGLSGELPTITVWSGAGANLNLIPTGEIIKKAWLDDPSQIGLDSDEPLCVLSASSDDGDCANSAAQIIHLKRIHQIKFPNLPRTASTLLSVVTENKQGDRALYQFRVAYGKGNPEYHTVTIFPDAPTTLQNRTSFASPSSPQQPSLENIELGLQVAKSRRLLGASQGNLKLQKRVETFLTLARGGESLKAAVSKAGVSMQLILKLAEFGSEQRQVSNRSSTKTFQSQIAP